MNFLSYNKYTAVGIFLLYVERLRVVGVASLTEQCADIRFPSVRSSLLLCFVSARWQFLMIICEIMLRVAQPAQRFVLHSDDIIVLVCCSALVSGHLCLNIGPVQFTVHAAR